MCRTYHLAAWHNDQQHNEEATKACLTSWKDQVVDIVVFLLFPVCALGIEHVAAGHGLTNEHVSDVHISCSLNGPTLTTALCLVALDSQTQYSAKADR